MSPTLHQKDPGTRLLAKLSPELENLQLLRQLSFLCFFSLFFFFFCLAKYSISLDFSTKPYLGFIYYLFF